MFMPVCAQVQRSMFSRGVAFQLVQIYATLISNSLSQVRLDSTVYLSICSERHSARFVHE